MAQINLNNFRKIEKERNTVHTRVNATYSSYFINGEQYFQIDTYGNSDRQMPEKISQTIQLNKETATLLIKLLSEELNIK